MIFFLIIWSLSNLGFFALASSMSKHQKQIYLTELDTSKTRFAHCIGWLILLITLGICISQGQMSNMMSYWVGVLTFSALFVGLMLSYFPEKIKKLMGICLLLPIISGLLYLL